MSLKVFNTLTKEKEEFSPINPPEVKMYVCGITPYDETHLGHARAYVTFDIIYRYLKFSDYNVFYVQNITDIDDKIINKSKEKALRQGSGQAVSCQQIAEEYTNKYFEVMDSLNIKRADKYPRATEHIKDMVKWISTLIEKGYAYVIDGDVYYEVDRFKDYGKLSKRKKKDMVAGARVAVDKRKRTPLDFALWKSAKEGEPSWESPWGRGRPGWHIECSIMSTKYLGEQFDIHGGGRDLIFPHHENEIAQTESYTEKSPWVRYWIHNGFININQQKMSKSLGNILTLKEIFSKYDPMVVRFFLLSTHYRSPISFSYQNLDEAMEAYNRICQIWDELNFLMQKVEEPEDNVEVEETVDELIEYRSKFFESMDDDFNTASAIGAVFELIKYIHEEIKKEIIDKGSLSSMKNLLSEFLNVLGIKLSEKGNLATEVEGLIKEREDARKNKDFEKADSIRKKLEELDIILEDTPYGTRWRRC